MKEAVLTLRVPAALRRRVQELARREGRSLSAQAERLLEDALARSHPEHGRPPRGIRSLAGCLRSGRAPLLRDFRAARDLLASSIERSLSRHDEFRR